MPVLTRVLVLLAAVLLPVPSAWAAASASAAADETWVWPLAPRPVVVSTFDGPDDPYGAGHRGVDLAGSPGADVRAVAAGVVTFAGSVAGVPVVTVDHGGTRSTYQPVEATVTTGDAVGPGEALGTLSAVGSHCAPEACLHLGRLVGPTYADPLELLDDGGVRLYAPSGPVPVAPAPPAVPGGTFVGDGRLDLPVDAPVTSPFGMRVHPVTGAYTLHDGTDLGAGCGTPVTVAAPGVVLSAYADAAYGNRVVVDHGVVRGHRLVTSYSHLTAWQVGVGDVLRRGQVVGTVGTTGLSTGCHLHLMVELDGTPVDPAGWL